MKTDIYQIVTDRIIAALEKGVCPWRRPWSTLSISPRNYHSQTPYKGINWFLLTVLGYELPYFLTYKQVTDLKGTVKSGSKGVPVVFWKVMEKQPTKEGEKVKKVPLLRYYTVFNASQIEGITFPEVGNRTGTEFNPVAIAEGLVAGWTGKPKIEHGYRQACYVPSQDVVRMPSPGSFDNPAAYYSTLFHELGHATGAKHRLDRDMSGKFGSDSYSREELVAEMTSAFLCAHCGIDNAVIEQQAAYLENWLNALKADPKLVVTAANQAQRAAALILGTQAQTVAPTTEGEQAPATEQTPETLEEPPQAVEKQAA
jgi:antirestriction protein ArdC